MIVYAQCLLFKGLVIPKHHIVRQHQRVIGSFRLGEHFDPQMKRMCRKASLAVADLPGIRIAARETIGHDALPPLSDANIVYWNDRVFTVTGFESVEVSPMQECSYRQSWLLRFPTEDELDDIMRDGMPRHPGPTGFGVEPEKPPREFSDR